MLAQNVCWKVKSKEEKEEEKKRKSNKIFAARQMLFLQVPVGKGIPEENKIEKESWECNNPMWTWNVFL